MDTRIVALILLQLVGLPALQSGHLLDINHNPVDLRLDTIYAIHNHATNLPLLHDRPGTNVTRLSHWWTLVHLEDNIYYLQIQEIRANLSAPRWDRRVRIQASSTPGYFHLYPVSCFKYKNSNPSDLFFYVDYFDEYGRDNSECVSVNSTKNGFRTKLEEENFGAPPGDILSKDNFEYKFTSLNDGLEEKLRESGKTISLATGLTSTTPNDENLPLPKLKLHEETNLMSIFAHSTEEKMTPYDCRCNEEIIIERPYFTFSIPSNSVFRLSIVTSPEKEGSSLSTVTISGWMGGQIENTVELQRSTWSLNWSNQKIPKDVKTLSILNMDGLNLNSDVSNRSSNYINFDKSRNDFKFYWTSSSPSTQLQVRFGTPEDRDMCTCHVAMFWYIHPVNIMGGLIFMMFGVALIYSGVVRSRTENNGLRDTSAVDSHLPHNCKFRNNFYTLVHRYGLSAGSVTESNEKKIMLQNI